MPRPPGVPIPKKVAAGLDVTSEKWGRRWAVRCASPVRSLYYVQKGPSYAGKGPWRPESRRPQRPPGPEQAKSRGPLPCTQTHGCFSLRSLALGSSQFEQEGVSRPRTMDGTEGNLHWATADVKPVARRRGLTEPLLAVPVPPCPWDLLSSLTFVPPGRA